MMRINIVDYVANPGGGVRFAMELMRSLSGLRLSAHLRLVSHGPALRRYRELVASSGLQIDTMDIAPHGRLLNPRRLRILESPLGPPLKLLAARVAKWHFDVSEAALEGCDVAWFPWMYWHRLPDKTCGRLVASFHDTIMLDLPEHFQQRAVNDERETTQQWIRSQASVVVSSNATAARLEALFGVPRSRYDVIRLAATHAALERSMLGPASKRRPIGSYLLCAANLSPHKNHETLFIGFAKWGAKWPLVLVGEHSDLQGTRRGAVLKRLAHRLGLRLGSDLVTLGYVEDLEYADLLGAAAAVVVPSRAEGGGSFPAWEALLRGIPVVCSDIPVMREQVEWLGAKVLWFDPHDPASLADRLRELERRYASLKQEAVRQVASLRNRTWEDVAREYWQVFTREE